MKEKTMIIFIIAALLGGAFYWFEWRPNQIRKDCQFIASHPLKGVGLLSASPETRTTEEIYKDCLREHGLGE